MPYQRSLTQQEREYPEQPLRGPFGGIQSELPADAIETLGFSDCLNVILRKGTASVRPGYTALPVPVTQGATPVLGIADFFDVRGNRHQAVVYKDNFYEWDAVNKLLVRQLGTLNGGITDYFSFAVVNSKLCFSQNVDKVQLWDGINGSFAAASVNAPAAKHLIELETHLLCLNTLESGVQYTQRVRWSGAGDPTDFSSFSSGSADLLNSLGPITGAFDRLYGYGYALHNFGLTQIVPTGIGSVPFNFVPFSAGGKGCICRRSPASYGEELGFYVGSGDVYLFNGSQSTPIGARPLDEKRRVGARKLIMAELALANLDHVFGYVTSTINGNDYNAYWLQIPNGSLWMYNIDEENWSRHVYDKMPITVGRFFNQSTIRIIDLVGSISQQAWVPDALPSGKVFDEVLIGFDDGTPGLVDYTNFSESDWFIKSGEIICADRRHGKVFKGFRIVYQDMGEVTFKVTIDNEKGETESHDVIVGDGSNLTGQVVVPLRNSCMSLRWTISGEPNTAASFIEFTPVYDVAGEYKDTPNNQSYN